MQQERVCVMNLLLEVTILLSFVAISFVNVEIQLFNLSHNFTLTGQSKGHVILKVGFSHGKLLPSAFGYL